jgi:NAD(P)-dependent dehydrogenase (short-subunit alcohol dehydrogenase family)
VTQRFAGKVAIVTGSSQGIGKATALKLASEGAKVILNGRNPENLATVVQEFESRGYAVAAVATDITEPHGPAQLVAKAIESFGRIDLLVNNLMLISYEGRPHLIDRDTFAREVVNNSWIAIGTVKEAMAAGLADGGGSVVNVSAISTRKRVIVQMHAIYTAAKAALESLTRNMALDLAGDGVRVNAVAPGLTRTEGTRPVWEGREEQQSAVVPLGRIGEPSDVANAIAFLLSDEASYITGQVIDVDGGSVLTGKQYWIPGSPST